MHSKELTRTDPFSLFLNTLDSVVIITVREQAQTHEVKFE